jgi:riboflavin synthase
MFTGLIEEIGEILAVRPGDGVTRITIRAPRAVEDADYGASIAVSGVCLTVVGSGSDWFDADVMPETLIASTIGDRSAGDRVNIERALRADARLGGHIVQGHVDGTAEVRSVVAGERWSVLRFALDASIAPLVVRKGSIAIEGVSLTVSATSTPGEVDGDWFEVSLIPETLEATTLGALTPGDRVNVETDILARHLLRLTEFGSRYGAEGARSTTGDDEEG